MIRQTEISRWARPIFVPRSSGYRWIWISVGAMAAADGFLSILSGITIVFPLSFFAATAFLVLVALFYGPMTNRDRRLFELSHVNALLIVIMVLGLVMNIEMASFGGHLVNRQLDASDKAMGFDWLAAAHALESWPALADVLRGLYIGFIPEVFVAANLLAFFGDEKRIVELAAIAIGSLAVVNIVFLVFPADNADTIYGGGIDPIHMQWSSMLMALRNHSADRFRLEQMQGLISFPSFHTTMAIVLMYVNRGKAWFIPFLAFNIAMLFSVPAFGGHYLTDMLAGAAVALLCIAAMRGLTAWTPRRATAGPDAA